MMNSMCLTTEQFSTLSYSQITKDRNIFLGIGVINKLI